MKKNQLLLATATISLCGFMLTGCQSLPQKQVSAVATVDQQNLKPERLEKFRIKGKFGYVNKAKNQSASAFYTWLQAEDRFAMELEGALGIGYTYIDYDGQTAQLKNAQLGTITSDTPEGLLKKATGWNAPISQMPYWISGLPTPKDTASTWDNQNRLKDSVNGDWSANFYYKNNNKLPRKIVAYHKDSSKVTLIINHEQ